MHAFASQAAFRAPVQRSLAGLSSKASSFAAPAAVACRPQGMRAASRQRLTTQAKVGQATAVLLSRMQWPVHLCQRGAQHMDDCTWYMGSFTGAFHPDSCNRHHMRRPAPSLQQYDLQADGAVSVTSQRSKIICRCEMLSLGAMWLSRREVTDVHSASRARIRAARQLAIDCVPAPCAGGRQPGGVPGQRHQRRQAAAADDEHVGGHPHDRLQGELSACQRCHTHPRQKGTQVLLYAKRPRP